MIGYVSHIFIPLHVRQLLMHLNKPLVHDHEPLYIAQTDIAAFILQHKAQIPLESHIA